MGYLSDSATMRSLLQEKHVEIRQFNEEVNPDEIPGSDAELERPCGPASDSEATSGYRQLMQALYAFRFEHGEALDRAKLAENECNMLRKQLAAKNHALSVKKKRPFMAVVRTDLQKYGFTAGCLGCEDRQKKLVDEEKFQSHKGTRPYHTEDQFRRHNDTCQNRIKAELQKTDWGRKRVENHQNRLKKHTRKVCTLSAPQMGVETEGTSVQNAIMYAIPNVDSGIVDKLAPQHECAVEIPLQREQRTKCDNRRGTSALSTSARCQHVKGRQLQPVHGTAGNWCEVFGFTWGCQACESIAEAGSTSVSHSNVCKTRTELLSSELSCARGVRVKPSAPIS